MKILNDLLKSPNGKYSRKSVIIMITFVVTLSLGAYIVIAEVLNSYASGVFDSLLLFLAALLSIATADKKIFNKSVPNTTEEATEI